jgi:hypothetical protein
MEIPHKKEIERIIGQMQCSKDFQCYESGFENLCKARDIGLDTFLECLEEPPQKCLFTISHGGAYYCKCPLRVYIGKELKK